MSERYILDGHVAVPCPDLMTWAKWFEDDGHWRIAHTQLTDNLRVSTVFLGLNHNFMLDGPPLIFETMVFGGVLDGEQERYSTWEEAELGHAAMLARVEETRGPGEEIKL